MPRPLPKQREAALARRKSRPVKKLKRPLAGKHLAAAHNTPMLILNEVRLCKATGGMLGDGTRFLFGG